MEIIRNLYQHKFILGRGDGATVEFVYFVVISNNTLHHPLLYWKFCLIWLDSINENDAGARVWLVGAVFCCLAGSGTTAWCKDWSCYILHRHSYHQLAGTIHRTQQTYCGEFSYQYVAAAANGFSKRTMSRENLGSYFNAHYLNILL